MYLGGRNIWHPFTVFWIWPALFWNPSTVLGTGISNCTLHLLCSQLVRVNGYVHRSDTFMSVDSPWCYRPNWPLLYRGHLQDSSVQRCWLKGFTLVHYSFIASSIIETESFIFLEWHVTYQSSTTCVLFSTPILIIVYTIIHYRAKVFEHLWERQKVVWNSAVFEQIFKKNSNVKRGGPLLRTLPPCYISESGNVCSLGTSIQDWERDREHMLESESSSSYMRTLCRDRTYMYPFWSMRPSP